jgi:ketosteroid isomerase-like protein
VSVDGPDPGRMSGLAAVTELNRDFLSAWRDWRVIAEEIRPLDDERALVLTRRIGAWADFAPSEDTGFDPTIEWHLDSGHPDQRVLRGLDEVADYFRGWTLSFDRMRVEVAEYLDTGEYVVTPFVVYGQLRGSSAEVELAETWTFRVRDGAIVEVREYLDRSEALHAVGLDG